MPLKRNRQRWEDELSRIDPTRFEALIGEHYRKQGYRVEHVGAEAIGQQYDGGIDLKMYRGAEYVIVQCKRWNRDQVPHNTVHELLGLIVNEGASGAILVTVGEFTMAAKNAAAKHRRVQLIDGSELRAILGPSTMPDMQASVEIATRGADLFRRGQRTWRSAARTWSRGVWVARLVALAATFAIVFVIFQLIAGAGTFAGGTQSTVRNDLQSTLEAPVDAVISAVQRSTRIADPRRRIDREAARAALRPLRGVRSAIWLDRTHLVVMVDGVRYRTFGMIDEVCRTLSPLGDTLAVVVNLQDVTATTPDGATTLKRNCRLAEGERALFQPHREIDVTSRQLRETFKQMQKE